MIVYVLCVTLNYGLAEPTSCFAATPSYEACQAHLLEWVIEARRYINRNGLNWYPLGMCTPEMRT